MLFGRDIEKISGMCSPVRGLSYVNDRACRKSTIITDVGDPENAGTYNISGRPLISPKMSETPKMRFEL